MTLDDWQALGIICGALLAAVSLVNVLWRKVLRPMFKTMRLAGQLIEQLVGDEHHPSLMQRLADLQTAQAETQRKLEEHLLWHTAPGGRPARPAPLRPNGPGGTR